MAQFLRHIPLWLLVVLWLLSSLPFAFILLRRRVQVVVSFRGRKFKVTGYEIEDGKLIARMAELRRQAVNLGQTPVRLITFRQEFRRIANWPRVHAMITCLNQPDEETVRLAIWLLGRKHARYGIPLIVPCSHSPDVRVRREAARALRRLGAWSELRAIYEFDTDEQVLRIALPERPKPFEQRLSRFTGDAPEEVPAARHSRVMSFFARVPIGPGKMPNTPEYIRTILERIHRLVHG
jgi:HEAT repeats